MSEAQNHRMKIEVNTLNSHENEPNRIQLILWGIVERVFHQNYEN